MEPIRVPLSVHQVARLAAFKADQDALTARFNDTVTAMVAAVADPASLRGWTIQQVELEIVCTPPVDVKPQLELVPDIGPEGVSASAEVSA